MLLQISEQCRSGWRIATMFTRSCSSLIWHGSSPTVVHTTNLTRSITDVPIQWNDSLKTNWKSSTCWIPSLQQLETVLLWEPGTICYQECTADLLCWYKLSYRTIVVFTGAIVCFTRGNFLGRKSSQQQVVNINCQVVKTMLFWPYLALLRHCQGICIVFSVNTVVQTLVQSVFFSREKSSLVSVWTLLEQCPMLWLVQCLTLQVRSSYRKLMNNNCKTRFLTHCCYSENNTID